jgi:hypothetical protein
VTIISAHDKTVSFVFKIQIWGTCVEKNISDCFLTLNDFLAEPERQLNEDVCSDIMHHLQGLQVTVRDYFPPKVEDFQWL